MQKIRNCEKLIKKNREHNICCALGSVLFHIAVILCGCKVVEEGDIHNVKIFAVLHIKAVCAVWLKENGMQITLNVLFKVLT